MAESDIKVKDIQNVSKDVHNNKNTEEQADEVKLDRKMEDTQETNNDSTISLKSFKMVDDKHKSEDQSKIDNDVKTNRNQNNSEDIQEEVRAPKCYNCIYEVSEFLPWFCVNLGRWCSNSFKRNCCFCCNKKVVRVRRGAFYKTDEEHWDENVINDGDLTRYSLPVCVDDDDGTEDESIKIKFHRNLDFDEDDIKIENVDFKNCDNVNNENIDMNKESDHDSKTVTHDNNHRIDSHGHCDVQSYSHSNISHNHNNDLNKCDDNNKGVSGNIDDTKTVKHDDKHRNNNHGLSDIQIVFSHDNISHDQYNYLKKCDIEYKGDSSMSKVKDHDTKTVTHDNNHHRYSHMNSDMLESSHGVSSHDPCNDFNKHENVNKEDIHMSKASDHDNKTVSYEDNHHSYGHGHSDVHTSSHGISNDNLVSDDYNTHSHTDTGYSGGDVGGCDNGGFSSDW